MSGGVVVWLADKQTGQQDPVPVVHSGYLDNGIADAEHQRHANSMTKQGGLRREITAQTQPDITEPMRAVIGKLIFRLIARKYLSLFGLNGSQLGINGPQV